MTFYLSKEAAQVLTNNPTEEDVSYLIETNNLSDELVDELFAQMDNHILNSNDELTLIEIIEKILKTLDIFNT